MLLRWSESLAAIARTGLGFTESLYEQERFEEVLRVAADIRAAADGGSRGSRTPRAWSRSGSARSGKGIPGYVTPKVAVGAAVGNDKGELLLIKRADSGVWLYPTGWCDVGYSAAEVVVKEVLEETGIEAEPVRLIAVLDGLRLGFTRVPLYSLLFHCRAVGGELAPHPLECSDVGWFSPDNLPTPLVGASDGASTSSPPSRARSATSSTTGSAGRCGGARATGRPQSIAGRGRRRRCRRRPACAAVTASCRSCRAPRPPPTPRALERIVADPATTLFVAEDDGPDRRHAHAGRVRDPDGRAGLDRGRGGRRRRPGARASPPRWSRPRCDHASRVRLPHGRPDLAARPRGREPALRHGARVRNANASLRRTCTAVRRQSTPGGGA